MISQALVILHSFCTHVFTVLGVLKEINSAQTLLFCAGGQSSSLTPNVTPAGGFFSKGFLISPGMPFLHVPLSLGGLVSSACTVQQWKLYNCLFFSLRMLRKELSVFPTFVHVLPLLLRFGWVWTCSFGLSFPSQQRVPDAQRLAWRFGRRLRLAACRAERDVDVKHKMSSPIRAHLSGSVCEILLPPSFTLTSSRCCTPWSSCWWGHGWWRPRSKKRKKKEGRKQ